MKLRSLLALLFIFLSTGLFAQYTVNIFINGIKSGQYMIKAGQEDGGIFYKKKVYKNMDRLVIEVKGKSIAGKTYKKSVDVTDDEQRSIYMAAETPGLPGQFILTDNAVMKRLGKGKIVKLFLQMDPANPKMMAPSKRIFIGNLTAK